MKKLLLAFIVLLNIFLFIGCSPKESALPALSVEQQKAVKNSIKFIKDSSFTSKKRIDTNIIKIENATENTWKSIVSKSGETTAKENSTDATDWIITIGNTSGHDFAIIVCDSSTQEVIGYRSIK